MITWADITKHSPVSCGLNILSDGKDVPLVKMVKRLAAANAELNVEKEERMEVVLVTLKEEDLL